MYFKKYSLFIVTEELGDSLYGRYLHKTFRKPDDNELRFVIRELFTALKFLKENGVLHCDLKPENILFDKKKQCIKLVDFGSASFCDDCSYFYLQTKPYRAPEITLGESYDFSIDVWSVGCIIYELLTSEVLFGYKTAIENLAKAFAINKHFDLKFYNRIQQKEDQVFQKNVLFNKNDDEIHIIVPQKNYDFEEVLNLVDTHPDLIDLLKRCLKINPVDRITPQEALEHKFLKNFSQFKSSNQQKYFQLISANALSSA